MRDDDGLGAWAEFGTAAGLAAIHGVDAVPAREGLGAAPGGWGGDAATVREGFGAAPDLDDLSTTGAGDLGHGLDLDGLPPVTAPLGETVLELSEQVDAATPPEGYHDRVDADGDGHLDHATYRGDGHGGAEILVDLNGDGRADFIGHDTDLDNRVDFADYDKDHDGFFEERMYDTNHDGILDRATWIHDS